MSHKKPRTGRRHALPTPVLGLAAPQRATRGSESAPLALVFGRQVAPLPKDGQPLKLGGAPGADLIIPGDHVSGIHAQLVRRSGRLWIEDLGSTNGVWKHGRRVAEAPLAADDCVLLGRTPVLVAEQLADRRPSTVIWHGILARDPRSVATLCAVARCASNNAAVWIRGASGSGKEGVARALHAASERRTGSFVPLNCAALPETLAESELFGSERGAFTGARTRPGAFQQADGGTLFLDEVGDLPRSVQAKLLRVLETGQVQPVGASTHRRVDVRVISATWRDLEAEAESDNFRFDLLQRLAILRVEVPTLQERPGDIKPLTELFLREFGATGLIPAPREWRDLLDRPWTGNVRELRSVVRRAALRGSWSEIWRGSAWHPFPAERHKSDLRLSAEHRLAIARRAIRYAAGNRARAARTIGISRSTLYRWLRPTG